ncbi:MAG: hypothetical protein QNJ69_01195 [Gammaproteobacteria bacterium]|nr:hypothetical protein [Gammaproteobacteria bacterium]
MTLAFTIPHLTDGRTRIRWAGDDDEKYNIVEISGTINDLQGVDHSEPRMLTGSIIIEHPEVDWSTVKSQLTKQLSLQFIEPAPTQDLNAIASLNRGLDKIDGGLKTVNTDLQSLTVFLLAILAVIQAMRGQVMTNSISFLWYAISIAMVSRNTAE